MFQVFKRSRTLYQSTPSRLRNLSPALYRRCPLNLYLHCLMNNPNSPARRCILILHILNHIINPLTLRILARIPDLDQSGLLVWPQLAWRQQHIIHNITITGTTDFNQALSRLSQNNVKAHFGNLSISGKTQMALPNLKSIPKSRECVNTVLSLEPHLRTRPENITLAGKGLMTD